MSRTRPSLLFGAGASTEEEELRVPRARTALLATVVPAYAIGTSEGRGGKRLRGGGKQYFVSESMLLEHIPSPKTGKLV